MSDRGRFDCPVPWCIGARDQHGGHGASPDAWFHEDAAPTSLPHGVVAMRSQEGGRSVLWSLTLDQEVFAERGRGQLASMLRDIASALDEIRGN